MNLPCSTIVGIVVGAVIGTQASFWALRDYKWREVQQNIQENGKTPLMQDGA
jgi:hypothetical protein